MEKENNEKSGIGEIIKNIFFFIIIIVAVYYVYSWYSYKYNNNDWALIVSSSETPSIDSVIKRLEGVKTKDSCYSLAAQYTPKDGSWECARGNLNSKYGYDVYKEVCTIHGCRK